ncbi:MAG: citrate/2-methylcitrate synthase [Planctomycetaceae bacterium]
MPQQLEWYHPGLQGVVAGETEICSLADGLLYRGYCIHELAEQASFLEVAHLLLHERLPNAEELADFNSLICEAAALPSLVAGLLEQMPMHAAPVDVLRTGLSLLTHDDPQFDDGGDLAGVSKAVTLIARFPLPACVWHRAKQNWEPFEWSSDESYAANLFRGLTNRSPHPHEEQALDSALVVSMEQEFNPATFAARIVGSNNGDLYCAVLAGLAVHGGRRHSGDYDTILQLLRSGMGGVKSLLADRERVVPGFGHPVFVDCDPRASILENWTSQLAMRPGVRSFEAMAEEIEHAVWEARKLPPNLDWAFARLLHYMGLPSELHLPVFLCARCVGWCAHALEQSLSGVVIRPRARYRGALAAEFEPLAHRDG